MKPINCEDTEEVCFTYFEYLKSDHWKNLKDRYYKSKMPKGCYICGTFKNLNLHHKTYKRVGREFLGDLVYLCRMHHDIVHRILATKKRSRTSLWSITRKMQKQFNR